MDLAASNGQFLRVPLPAVAIGFLTTFLTGKILKTGSNKDECTPRSRLLIEREAQGLPKTPLITAPAGDHCASLTCCKTQKSAVTASLPYDINSNASECPVVIILTHQSMEEKMSWAARAG
jgi:hypothetical protein